MNDFLKQYVNPFDQSEIEDYYVINKIDLKSMKEELERKSRIISIIEHFFEKRENAIESINGFAGTFPELRKEYLHDIDIYTRAIKRLISKL